MKAFVTGAGGFIGSHLCEALRDAGHAVTGMAHYRSQDTFGWLDEVEGIEKVRGDIRDADQKRALIKGHDVVFHLAALGSVPYSYETPRAFIDTNVIGTLNVLTACRDTGARIIHASTSEVYGTAQYEPQDEKHPLNPQSPYAASKVAADALVNAFHLSYGLPAVILRPFNTFGPRQSERAVVPAIIRQALDGRCGTIQIGATYSRRDLTYVKDTVDAFIKAAELYSVGPWNVGTGICTGIWTLADQLRETFSSKPVVSIASRVRPEASEVRALRCDAGKFSKATGWRPKHTLSEGLKETIAWWKSRPMRGTDHVV